MVRFLLDTNILSEPLRPQPNLTVMQRLIDQSEELATAAVVYHEMLFGLRRLPDEAKQADGDRFSITNRLTWPKLHHSDS